MPITATQIIAIKRKLRRSLISKAAQWRNPLYLPFVDKDRRHTLILVLTLRAKTLQEEIHRAVRNGKYGADSGWKT
jgi:hypothetical protein